MNYILFFAVLVAGAVFGYILFFDKANSSKEIQKQDMSSLSDKDQQKLVDRYLKETQSSLRKQEAASQKAITNKELPPPKKSPVVNVDPQSIPIEQQIWRESKASDQSLEERFSQQSFQTELASRQEDDAKREYARQFIENARREGYHITLSEDLEILSVKPIRKPTNNNYDAFEPNPSN